MKFIPFTPLFSLVLLFLSIGSSFGLEKKSILEVTTDQLLVDTQVSPQGADDDHTAVVWWIPQEFWDSTYARDASVSEKDKEAMNGALKGVTLLGVVQADLSRLGALKFYPKEDVQRNLQVTYTDEDGNSQKVELLTDLNPDLKVLLGAMKPILAQALGNMGENLHFFVLKDSDADGQRLINPYKGGSLNVSFEDLGGTKMKSEILLPLNSLFVPRKCPNGRDANVTWVFCPWSGEKL
jgi:hypothetical protein